MGCPSLSELRAYMNGDLEHGALLDALVETIRPDSWEQASNAIDGLGWPTWFSSDGESLELLRPLSVREIIAHRHAGGLLQVRSPCGLKINFHLTVGHDTGLDPIEFDFAPREFVGQRHVDEMCEFISVLGRALNSVVVVCIEGGMPNALLSFEPTTNDVLEHDWRDRVG